MTAPALPLTIRSTAIIEDNVTIGVEGFIGHFVIIRSGCRIGNRVVIGHNSVLEEGVEIGDDTRIQACCYITKGSKLGRKVFVGPRVTTLNEKIISAFRPAIPQHLVAAEVRDFARIGGGSTLLPGVVVGENALVGAGSVVTKHVPDGEIWFGHPAKRYGKVPPEEMIR